MVLDIGTGFNTPSVIRWPAEELTRSRPHTRLVRINGSPKVHSTKANQQHAEVPLDIKDRSVELPMDATEAVTYLCQQL